MCGKCETNRLEFGKCKANKNSSLEWKLLIHQKKQKGQFHLHKRYKKAVSKQLIQPGLFV